MKMRIGVDDELGVIHSNETTCTNEHGITQLDKLLDGKEEFVWGDAGYLGVEKREEFKDRDINWCIAARPGARKEMSGVAEKAKKIKAQVRAKVEHPFRRIKEQFGYAKVRYKDLSKNINRLYVLAAFSNLLICRNYMLT